MSSPTLIIGDGNWAVRSGSLLGYEYGELSGQFAPIPITGSRASIATYTDQSGLIVSASNDVLRVDYSTGTGSLLIEPQRTNLILQSETFDNVAWTAIDSTVTANAEISPSGATNAETMTITSTTSRVSQNIVLGAGTFQVSVYVKVISQTTAGTLRLVGIVDGTNVNSNFTPTNQWQRVVGTYTPLVGITNLAIRGVAGQFVGTIAIWGFQCEQGAYPTTYIPTAGSTVTRIVDTFSRSNIYTDGVITSGGGTWLVELLNNVLVTRDTSDVGLFIGSSSNGVTGDCLTIRNNGTARLTVTKRIAGTQTGIFDTTTNTVKIAIKWNGTTADVFANGTKVVSATAFAATNMEFFRGLGGDVTKYITQNKFYNQPLSDAECISLTTL